MLLAGLNRLRCAPGTAREEREVPGRQGSARLVGGSPRGPFKRWDHNARHWLSDAIHRTAIELVCWIDPVARDGLKYWRKDTR